ncbi:MAG: thioredoxin family protein [Pseudolabrys sp.]
MRRLMKFSSLLVLIGVTYFALASLPAHAAELVMFEQAGCPWCARFDREIAPTYTKTAEGQRAPLRRVDIDKPIPPDLAFVQVERFTPVFVLVDKGREIGRIRGYPGEESFWMQLAVLFQKLDTAGTGGERAQYTEKAMRPAS